jgi:hypothetical protein
MTRACEFLGNKVAYVLAPPLGAALTTLIPSRGGGSTGPLGHWKRPPLATGWRSGGSQLVSASHVSNETSFGPPGGR